MVQRTVIWISLIFVALAIFFFIRLLYVQAWFYNISLDYHLVPIDVINLFVTVGVTIWIGYYIVKKLSEQRFEKEMLINDLKLIEQEVNAIGSLLQTSTRVDITHISSKINTIEGIINRFVSTIAISTVIPETYTNSLLMAFYSLYAAATDFDSLVVETSNINMPHIQKASNDVVIKTRELILRINKN